MWIYFWALDSVPLINVSIKPVYIALITIALQHSLNSGSVIPSALFFFLRITLVVQGLLWFHKNFRIAFSVTVKNAIGILIGTGLNLYMFRIVWAFNNMNSSNL